MGTDKALLSFRGRTLLEHQLATLRATGAEQIWISARDPATYASARVSVVCDEGEAIGPLGGIRAALRQCETPLLLVLGIDLPMMTANFLCELQRGAAETCGVVCQHADRFEPLAAVYPRAALPAIEAQVAGTDHALQPLVRRLHAAGLLATRMLAATEVSLFRNVNTPEDVTSDLHAAFDSTAAA